MSSPITLVNELLQQTAKAHHEAFAVSDGADPEWPLWYAERLLPELRLILDANLTTSELVYWLVRLDKKQRRESPEEPWSTYYAHELVAAFVD